MIQSGDMYKNLIIGVALMFILAGAYYINKAGGGELLAYMISGEKPSNLTPLNSASIPGVYVCDTKSGCHSKYVLLLRNDQSAEMVLIQDKNTSGENPENESITSIDESSVNIYSSSTPQDEQVINSETITGPSEEVSTLSSDTGTPAEDIVTEDFFDSEETTEEEQNPNKEKGTWDIAIQNMLVITLITQGTTTYEVPQKIVIKNVDPSKLSRISYTKSNYTDMIQPTFIRQE